MGFDLLKGYLFIVVLELVTVNVAAFRGQEAGFVLSQMPVPISIFWLATAAIISYLPEFLLKWKQPEIEYRTGGDKRGEKGESKKEGVGGKPVSHR